MDAIRVQCLEWEGYQLDAFLAFKIKFFLEEINGTSNAHGMGASSSSMFLYQHCSNYRL
jgi:hypothetical protein